MILVMVPGLKGPVCLLAAALAVCDPALAALFTPLHPQLGRYEVCTTTEPLDPIVPAQARIEAVDPLDALGTAGPYDRWAVTRLYGGRRVRVARAWAASGKEFESQTFLSPYPDATLTRLVAGTMIITFRTSRRARAPGQPTEWDSGPTHCDGTREPMADSATSSRTKCRGLTTPLLTCAMALVTAIGCSRGSGGGMTSPTPASGNPASTRTITITLGGVSPKAIVVLRGDQVTFINNDTAPHEMSSDPHPEHTDCTEINQVGFLSPGQSRQTGNLNTAKTCGYHDHERDTVQALQGTITIQ